MVEENNHDQFGVNETLCVVNGSFLNLSDTEVGFPYFEDNLYFPSYRVDGENEICGDDFRWNVGNID